MKTIAIAGCGRLSGVVLDAMKMGFLPEYKLTATYSRTYEHAVEFAAEVEGCQPCRSIEELIAARPDYIVEAASPAAMFTPATIMSPSFTFLIKSLSISSMQ